MGGNWSIVAYLAWGLAALLAITGVVLLWLGFLRDRGRALRRCPKCWYDMGGVPGLVCPECGYLAKAEAGLHRRRRSKWKIVLGALALALATGAGAWPKLARDGWWTAMPTIALIWMWPDVPEWGAAPPPGSAGGPRGGTRGGTLVVTGMGGAMPGPAKNGIEAILSAPLRPWERAALVRRCATVLDVSTDQRDRLVAVSWLRRMSTREIVPALPALARAAAAEGPLAPSRPVVATATALSPGMLSIVPRSPQVLFGGTYRPLIREVAEVCREMDGVVARAEAAGADAPRMARMAWAMATHLPEDDATVVGALAEFTLDDPLLLPDAVVHGMLRDRHAAGRLLKAIAVSMDNYMESPDRCERLLVAAGPATAAAIPELLGMASQSSGRAGREQSRAAFRVLSAIGPAALPDAQATLETWAAGGDAEGAEYLALWSGVTLANLREDAPLLVRTLSEALDPSRDWDVRHEALAMLHARTPQDGLINARVLLAAEHDSTLLQLGAVEALGRLSQGQPGLRAHVERLAREGKPRAREAARDFLDRTRDP